MALAADASMGVCPGTVAARSPSEARSAAVQHVAGAMGLRTRGPATSPWISDRASAMEVIRKSSFLTLASESMSVPSTSRSPASRSARPPPRRRTRRRYRSSAAARVHAAAAWAGAASVHGASSPMPTDFSDSAPMVANGTMGSLAP